MCDKNNPCNFTLLQVYVEAVGIIYFTTIIGLIKCIEYVLIRCKLQHLTNALSPQIELLNLGIRVAYITTPDTKTFSFFDVYEVNVRYCRVEKLCSCVSINLSFCFSGRVFCMCNVSSLKFEPLFWYTCRSKL